jgi:outer membrane protein assembly factor BamB
MDMQEPLFIGIGGTVVAIDRVTGAELWRRKLKRSNFVTIFADADSVYGGAGGELFCLDAKTGEIRWQNKLSGLGMSVISFGSASTAAVMGAAMASEAAMIAAVSATTAASAASQ